MSDTPEFNFDEAWERAEKGRNRASDHAEDESPGWIEQAVRAAELTVEKFNGEFTFEALRLKCEHLVDPPPDKRAWGTVAVRVVRRGLIVWTGEYGPTVHNCSPKKTYRKAGAVLVQRSHVEKLEAENAKLREEIERAYREGFVDAWSYDDSFDAPDDRERLGQIEWFESRSRNVLESTDEIIEKLGPMEVDAATAEALHDHKQEASDD